MSTKRHVREGVLLDGQGTEEEIVYTLDVSANGSDPTDVTVKVYSESGVGDGKTFTDVTSTVMPTGDPAVSGNVITLPLLKSLTVGATYRIEVKYTLDGNVLEDYFRIPAER